MPKIFDPTRPINPIHFNPDFPAFAAANPWVGAPTSPIQQLPGNILVQQYQNATAYAPAGDLPYEVHGAIRDQPACFMMGQAAGTAAVQSMKTGQPACDLDTAALVETLREAGAYLPQKSLSKKMTRDH